ncbi:MAG: hypothetical protein JXO22_01120 [Phycisphaerae bacterium]|nr:hypothetical protein [Phycisphaerae bacterium]
MLYAALTFWLFVIIFSAWGVHSLLSRLIKPRIVNSILLPGTLVAQLGHVLGLLVTGNAVQNTKLMGDDEKGEPTSEQPETHKIPIFGSILVGLLPLVACAACLYVATNLWGTGVMSQSGSLEVQQTLPTSIAAAWDLPRQCIDAMQNMLDAIIASDLPAWPTLLFLYLAVCLTVRMAPFEGHQRGAVGAIVLAGLVIWLIGSLTPAAHDLVLSSWPILSFAVAMLLFLLTLSLLLSGIVGLFKILSSNQ